MHCNGDGAACGIVADPRTPVEARYIAFVQQQIDERHMAHEAAVTTPATRGDSIAVGSTEQMQALLSGPQYAVWRAAKHAGGEEGFAVTPVPTTDGGKAVVLSAHAPRGELFAIGWLLRSADMHSGRMAVPSVTAFATAPELAWS